MNTYTITLHDVPSDCPERACREAEARFQRTLERALGGATEVIPAYKAWQTAEDTAESELSPNDITLARRWITAATRARQEGFRTLGADDDAYFEVRIAS